MSLFWQIAGMGTNERGVTLSGTVGTPNLSLCVNADPSDTTAGWIFYSNGTVQRYNGNPPVLVGFQSGIEWIDDTPLIDYWIRFDATLGTDPANGGDSSTGLIWLKLTGTGSADRSFLWEQTVVGTRSGYCKVEIATDSGGSNIVATGYYSGSAEVETGA